MTSSYEMIYSKYLGLITDHKLLALPKDKAYDLLGETFNLVKGKPKINRLFSSLVYDDEVMQITYTLNNSMGRDNYDQNFVEDVFANAMVVAWYEKVINADTNVNMYLGDKETKLRAA